MLDGRRRECGLRAGLTNSPDFFRTIGGLDEPTLSLSSVSESSLDGCGEISGCDCETGTGLSKTIFESVFDLE